MQRLMRDSNKTEAERPVQPEFRIGWLAAGALLALLVLLFRAELDRLPNRIEAGPRTVDAQFEPVDLASGSIGPFQVTAAWKLSVDDARFGGISALALDGDGFVALTDSGVIVRFPRPGSANPRALVDDLPGGPGRPGFKVNRDSEALAADPLGRGWWVAFENRDELWLYDRDFNRPLDRVALNAPGLARNRGIEGMVVSGQDLLLFPERGARAVSRQSGKVERIEGISGWLGDAVRLPDGRIAVIYRQATPIGLRNSLTILDRTETGYRAGAQWRMPIGRLDNAEALAAEPLPGGRTRLWVMTDNNFRQRQPTLLIALELRPRPAR